jgi:hypothetical protein
VQFERSLKAFREATRRDPNNAQALEGMILCQICEGAVEDAESQIELLTLMHSQRTWVSSSPTCRRCCCAGARTQRRSTSRPSRTLETCSCSSERGVWRPLRARGA